MYQAAGCSATRRRLLFLWNQMPQIDAEKIIAESDNAILIELIDGREIWIPFSQCERVLRRPDGSAQFVVTQWFADKEDLA